MDVQPERSKSRSRGVWLNSPTLSSSTSSLKKHLVASAARSVADLEPFIRAPLARALAGGGLTPQDAGGVQSPKRGLTLSLGDRSARRTTDASKPDAPAMPSARVLSQRSLFAKHKPAIVIRNNKAKWMRESMPNEPDPV